MKINRYLVLLSILTSAMVSSCAYYDEKNPPDPSLITTSGTWEKLSTEFFQPRCAICHGSGELGINVSDYNSVVANLSHIKREVVTRTQMPPDSPLTPYELKLISTWINAGAPY